MILSSERHLTLTPNLSPGALCTTSPDGIWRLEIPPGPKGRYRLAQLDDYSRLRRRDFPWQPPLRLALQARASQGNVPGTWGFGLWNDPFSLSLGLGGAARRLPALPNAAWFFFASPPNYLSLRDDLPATGALAAVFRSPALPAPLLALGAAALPLFFWKPAMRALRRMGRSFVQQDTASLEIDPAAWHHYSLEWRSEGVSFNIDDHAVFETTTTPRPPLGCVLWVDNQYAALPPTGQLVFGTLANPEAAWVEIKALVLDVTP